MTHGTARDDHDHHDDDDASEAAASGMRHVLVVEEDAARRDRLVAWLGAAGYTVAAAASGELALTQYAGAPVPLVLLDLDLPGIGGLELCRRIRALDAARATFVVVYSHRDDLDPLIAALDAGADDYMAQPASVAHLRARLVVAERRIAQEGARRAAEQAAASARYLAGIGEVAIALQHEINNPLAAILAHAELLAMDDEERGTSNDSVQTIMEQARRIADVVRRLSSLRNPTSIEYVPGKRMVNLE